MSKTDPDPEIAEIERHAIGTWLRNGDALVCSRCNGVFIPAGGRRGREGENGTETPLSGTEAHKNRAGEGRDGAEVCGSCLPLRNLELGDRSPQYSKCLNCGTDLRGGRADRKYCGTSCRVSHYQKRQRGSHEPAREGEKTEDSEEGIGRAIIRKDSSAESAEGGSRT